MKQLLMLALSASLILTSCSDDSTTTPTTNDTYVPSKTGAYVIHANKRIAAGTTTDIADDSTVVVGTMSIKDGANVTKTAIRHEVFAAGTDTDTLDIAQDGSKIFLNFPLAINDVEGVTAPNFGSRWVQIGDANGTTWTGLDETISNVTIDYVGTPLVANISFKVVGKKIGAEDLTINGTSVATMKYENTVTITIVIPAYSVTIPLSFVQTSWFGKNVGLVKQTQPAVQFSQEPIEFEVPGFESTAIRFGGQ